MNEIEIFRQFIKRKGLRNTPEREIIIEEIFLNHDHFDVEELYMRLRSKNRNISRASIYRTIPLLIESGLIKEVFFENGHLHYEHIYGHEHHCHLRCICCGVIVEFSEDEIFRIQDQIGKRHGFTVTSHRLEIMGYCPDCARNREGTGVCRPSGRNGTKRQ
jgi:Fur family ferric uptake transcriptional regulator